MTTYSANVTIVLTSNNYALTKFVGGDYATLDLAKTAATNAAQAIINQSVPGTILSVVPTFISIDLNDGVNLPIRIRTGEILAVWPSANQT